MSKMNDGICDCCDGSDERNSDKVSCKDICDEVLAEERAKREKAVKDFEIGHAKRNKEIADFQKKVKETLATVESLETQISELKTEDLTSQIENLKVEYSKQRLTTAKDLLDGAATSSNGRLGELVEPLTKDELVAFIVHVCQLSGEIDKIKSEGDGAGGDDNEDATCIPLRLAGLDMGILWGDKDYFDRPANNRIKRLEADSLELANLLYEGAINEKPVWKVGAGNGNRRRLDEIDYDDYEGSYDDDEYGGYGDDDGYDHDDYDDGHRRPSSRYNRKSSDEHELTGRLKELVEEVQETVFSKTTRVPFMTRSQQLNEELSKILDSDEDEDADENENADEGPESASEEDSANGEEKENEDTGDAEAQESTVAPVDPMAASMLRSTLSRKEGWIFRGYKCAASAKLLLSALESDTSGGGDASSGEARLRQELSGLAVGSIYHSQLKAEHVWQIIQTIIPEFSEAVGSSAAEQTCAAPWAGSCPPKTVSRNGSSLPPSYLIPAAEALCSEQVSEALEGACGSEALNDGLPTSIPEGYFGYVAATARNDDQDDPLHQFFAPMNAIQPSREEIESLEGKREELDKQRTDLEKQRNDLLKDIGGKKQKRLGPDGELYALKDTCHDVTAGKYIYEVCMFGKAAQKEKSTPKGGGTSLGRWSDNMEYNEETGERILKWEGGTKCWNGPSRSATVYMTCGAETVVLSAEEPETCKYVLQMESHIACDEAFKKYAGI